MSVKLFAFDDISETHWWWWMETCFKTLHGSTQLVQPWHPKFIWKDVIYALSLAKTFSVAVKLKALAPIWRGCVSSTSCRECLMTFQINLGSVQRLFRVFWTDQGCLFYWLITPLCPRQIVWMPTHLRYLNVFKTPLPLIVWVCYLQKSSASSESHNVSRQLRLTGGTQTADLPNHQMPAL